MTPEDHAALIEARRKRNAQWEQIAARHVDQMPSIESQKRRDAWGAEVAAVTPHVDAMNVILADHGYSVCVTPSFYEWGITLFKGDDAFVSAGPRDNLDGN